MNSRCHISELYRCRILEISRNWCNAMSYVYLSVSISVFGLKPKVAVTWTVSVFHPSIHYLFCLYIRSCKGAGANPSKGTFRVGCQSINGPTGLNPEPSCFISANSLLVEFFSNKDVKVMQMYSSVVLVCKLPVWYSRLPLTSAWK